MSSTLPPGWEGSVPGAVRSICTRLAGAGFAAYVVGGSLRDLALGRPVGDWDVATAAPPDAVMRLFPRTAPTGVAHGTVTVLEGSHRVEVTTFRGDGAYQDGRRPVSVTFVGEIAADLARRDFTVNAVAGDPSTGAVVDPFGGLDDVRARTIRAVGDPDARFEEDGLRPMRAARFAATLEFDLEPGTRGALARHLPTFRRVSSERVRDELEKMLAGAARPSIGIRILQGAGLLAEILPPLDRAVGFGQNRFHEFDLYEHTLRAVDGSPPLLPVRLAALLHDLGKLERRSWSEEKSDWIFFEHERSSARIAGDWLRGMRFSNDLRERVVALVAHHGTYYDESWGDAAVRRWVRRVGPDRVDEQIELLAADIRAKGDLPDVPGAIDGARRLHERVRALMADRPAMSEEQLALGGDEIMRILGIPPGRRVGEVKRALLEVVTEDPSCNTSEALADVVRRKWGDDGGRDAGGGPRTPGGE